MPNPAEMFRFEVAFSFAGAHREKVREIAELVAKQLGRNRVFFEEWYEHEILGDDMDVLLQRFYHEQSLLVLADLSDDYAGRPWCQAEARAIRALRFEIDPARDEIQRLRLLNVRFGPGDVPGIFKTTAYLDGVSKTAKQCADLILKRLGLLHERLAPGGPAESERISHTPDQSVVLHNLPFAPNPLFMGRDVHMKKLGKLLEKRSQGATLIVVHGLGGVGKTQLAIQYAWKSLCEFDAVLWVLADWIDAKSPKRSEVSSAEKGLEVSLAALASVLRLPEAKGCEQGVQAQAVLNWLRDHDRWLLIIDNADSDNGVQAVRRRLLPSLPGTVLITSRLSDWPINVSKLPLGLLSPKESKRYLLERTRTQEHEAGDEVAAGKLAKKLGYLPLALEQAASFIVEMRWSFAKYLEEFRDSRLELLSERREGGTDYPESVARTWTITIEQLGPVSLALLRLAAWLAPDDIPRGVFSADKQVLSEALNQQETLSGLAIEKALVQLARFSLIHLTSENVSVHRLVQAVQQDELTKEECLRWLKWANRLVDAFATANPTWRKTHHLVASISHLVKFTF